MSTIKTALTAALNGLSMVRGFDHREVRSSVCFMPFEFTPASLQHWHNDRIGVRTPSDRVEDPSPISHLNILTLERRNRRDELLNSLGVSVTKVPDNSIPAQMSPPAAADDADIPAPLELIDALNGKNGQCAGGPGINGQNHQIPDEGDF